MKGCGLGDIRWMLETKNLSGKCADLNALFVGLARAAGLPARDLYGIRVAPSAQFPSLGRAGGNITTAQHCRAEVYVDEFGWVPVDPADVRKLMLEERPQASLTDAYVARVRETLFGSWEMNWIAYNDAHDVALPGSTGKPLPFLMYPQAEAGGARRDSLDPGRLPLHDHRTRSFDFRHQLSVDRVRGPRQLRVRLRHEHLEQPHRRVRSRRRRARRLCGDGGDGPRSRPLVRLHRRPRRIEWTADGELAGLAAGFVDDMDAAIECASSAGMRLCLVLLDYSWMHDAGRQQYADD